MIFFEYMQRNYQNKFYGKVQNLVQYLMMEYNRIFKDYDVIVMFIFLVKVFKFLFKGYFVYGLLFFYLNYFFWFNNYI